MLLQRRVELFGLLRERWVVHGERLLELVDGLQDEDQHAGDFLALDHVDDLRGDLVDGLGLQVEADALGEPGVL